MFQLTGKRLFTGKMQARSSLQPLSVYYPKPFQVVSMSLSPLATRWMSSVKGNIRFTKDHEWVKLESDIATFGITDFAQKALGDVVYVELPILGKMYKKKDPIGAVESVKAASDIYAPVSGKIVEVNEILSGKTSLLNSDPYARGWIGKLKPTDVKQFEELLSESEYSDLIKDQ